MKVKVSWIVLLCSFFSLFYVIYKLNNKNLAKHFTFIEIGSGNRSVMKIDFHTTGQINKTHQISRVFKIKNDSLFGQENENQSSNRARYDSFLSLSATTEELRVALSGKTNDSENFIETVNNGNNGKIRIGILIPSSTRKLNNPILEDLSLIKICIPSFYKTMENLYEYMIYIGIDKGDYLETVVEKLERFEKVKTVVTIGRTFTKSVNAIARRAYEDGMDYLVRINDDTSFETNNWTSEGISVLKKYSPNNIGVVGPTCHQGNTAILTHDMVHRTHLEIFDFYYPPYFDNWWADDWITKVYSPDRSTKLSTWVVKHYIGSHGTRYNVDYKKEARLVKMLTFDRERLNEYVSNLK